LRNSKFLKVAFTNLPVRWAGKWPSAHWL